MELRERIIDAVDQQPRTVAEIAEIFEVTERYVYKLLKQRRERGTLAPLPHGGGARAKLDEAKRTHVVDLVARTPDATLAELQQQMKTRLHVEVGVGTVWTLLNSLGLTRKKSSGARVTPLANPRKPSFSSKGVRNRRVIELGAIIPKP